MPVNLPEPMTPDGLRDDWADRPGLTDEDRAKLSALPDEVIVAALQHAFRTHEDMWHHVIDSTRADATYALIARHIV